MWDSKSFLVVWWDRSDKFYLDLDILQRVYWGWGDSVCGKKVNFKSIIGFPQVEHCEQLRNCLAFSWGYYKQLPRGEELLGNSSLAQYETVCEVWPEREKDEMITRRQYEASSSVNYILIISVNRNWNYPEFLSCLPRESLCSQTTKQVFFENWFIQRPHIIIS